MKSIYSLLLVLLLAGCERRSDKILVNPLLEKDSLFVSSQRNETENRVFNPTHYVYDINMCECELKNDSLFIHLRPTQLYPYHTYSNCPPPPKSMFGNEVKLVVSKKRIDATILSHIRDTVNVIDKQLILSDNKFVVGKKLFAEAKINLPDYEKNYRIKFKCKIIPYHIPDIAFIPISEEDLYDVINNAVLPKIRDTTTIKKIGGEVRKFSSHFFEEFVPYLKQVEHFSLKEIDFMKAQCSSGKFDIDSSLKWTNKISKAHIVTKNEYEKAEIEFAKTHAYGDDYSKFLEAYYKFFVPTYPVITYLSKPIISSNRKIAVFYEYNYEPGNWCGTGTQRIYLMKKIGDKWQVRLYFPL